MTRKNLNSRVDELLALVAEANDLDPTDGATGAITRSLLLLALEKHEAELVRSATAGNRLAAVA
jgi:hypothetical protein